MKCDVAGSRLGCDTVPSNEFERREHLLVCNTLFSDSIDEDIKIIRTLIFPRDQKTMIDLHPITLFNRKFECVHYLDFPTVLCTQEGAQYCSQLSSEESPKYALRTNQKASWNSFEALIESSVRRYSRSARGVLRFQLMRAQCQN